MSNLKMLLELDDKEWDYNDHDLSETYEHLELDLFIEHDSYITKYKYYVSCEYLNQHLYACNDLSLEDINYIVRHYARMLEIYEYLDPRNEGKFYCKLCKKASLEFLYPHFRTEHDVVTKSASKQ